MTVATGETPFPRKRGQAAAGGEADKPALSGGLFQDICLPFSEFFELGLITIFLDRTYDSKL